MSLIENKLILKNYAEAVSVPLSLSDTTKWPIRAGRVLKPVLGVFAQEILSDIRKLGLGDDPSRWKSYFDTPTQLWRLSHHFINGLIDSGSSPSEIADQLIILLGGIRTLSSGHMFNIKGSHLTMNDDEASGLLAWCDSTIPHENGRDILRLSVALWSYTEALYFVAREISCEYHGPYFLNDGRLVIVRDFKYLKPIDLWSEDILVQLPEPIRIVTMHNPTISVYFDVYNNLYVESGDMLSSLEGGWVLLGNASSVKDVSGLLQSTIIGIGQLAEFVQNMDSADIIKRYINIFWYRKARLALESRGDWRPREDIITAALSTVNDSSGSKTRSTPRPAMSELASRYDYSEYLR